MRAVLGKPAVPHSGSQVVSSKQWGRMCAVDKADVRVLKCTATSMELFDRLTERDDTQRTLLALAL